jgi:hypothetical protein
MQFFFLCKDWSLARKQTESSAHSYRHSCDFATLFQDISSGYTSLQRVVIGVRVFAHPVSFTFCLA